MIDVAAETVIPVLRIRDFLPSGRNGKKLSKGIIFRWISRGVRGGQVRETVKIGGARYTSIEALQRFVVAQNAGITRTQALPNVLDQARAKSAACELTKRGIF